MLCDVAEQDILPRWRRLEPGDVREKAPGDFVTVADRAAEEHLGRLLTSALPGSAVVGEEAVAYDQGILRLLDGDRPVWVIDPIDGTKNFVKGRTDFATLVALLHRGQIVASWTYGPATGRTGTALAGHGAFIDGERAATSVASAELSALTVATSRPSWWTPQQRWHMTNLQAEGVRIESFANSGLEYLNLAAGTRTAMLLYWDNIWDHAAGLLLCSEAGGAVIAADGGTFRLSGATPLPFVAAADAATATALQRAMNA